MGSALFAFFGDQHEEAADFLLVDGLTDVEALDLRLVTGLDDLDLDLDVAGVLVGESQNVERAGFLVGSRHQIGFVRVFDDGRDAGDHTVENAGALRVGVDCLADNRLFESGLPGRVAADAFTGLALRDRGVGIEFQRFGLGFCSRCCQSARQCLVALLEAPFRRAAGREQQSR